MTRFTHEDANKLKKWPMAANGVWGIDVDGAQTNGGGIVGGVTVTQATSASLAKTFDDSEGIGTWGNIDSTQARGGYTFDDQLFPDSPEDDDAVAFGGAIPFCEIALGVTGGGASVAIYNDDDVLGWEYSDGVDSWASFALAVDNTESGGGTGDRAFSQDGALSFVPPSDWASVAIDGQTAYWIRARVAFGKGANMTQIPTTDAEFHSFVTPLAGFTCPHGGVITGIRVSDAKAGTLHTAIKFILMNFTTGAHSGEKTWTSGQRQDSFTGLTLAVNQGDVLGVLNTDEDGTNEPTNVALELQVSG